MLLCILDGESSRAESDKANQLENNLVLQKQKKDKDNIAFGIKFILDGMIEARVIANDGWGEIANFEHRFEVDKDCPRIEIELEEENVIKEKQSKDYTDRALCKGN